MATEKNKYKRYPEDDIREIINKLEYIRGYLVARSQKDSADVVSEIIEKLRG